MITLQNIHKSYCSSKNQIIALNNINLHIGQGQIFGIIGHSGAGKSTLLRCLNLLERPDLGSITINGLDMMQLNTSELRRARRKISMIFQHFNLFSSQTVSNNIAFPLRLEGWSTHAIEARVQELLTLVGLENHAHHYPSQLSGGQKQRVGIARALANSPTVLLCDEATSALDPQTTQSILELLAEINRRLNLTIVLITHEMDVIRKICHQVAVIHDGTIIEHGAVEQVFLHPQHAITQGFIEDNQNINTLLNNMLLNHAIKTEHILKITYSGADTFAPHLSTIVKECNVDFSILAGNIGYIRELPYGQMIVALNGSNETIKQTLMVFQKHGIHCQALTLKQQ